MTRCRNFFLIARKQRISTATKYEAIKNAQANPTIDKTTRKIVFNI